jgi:PAS domain S-box-containing protein
LLGALLVAAFITYHITSGYRSELARWSDRQSSLADEQASGVSSWLKERQADAEVLAQLPSLKAFLLEATDKRPSEDSRLSRNRQLTQLFDRFTRVYGYLGVYLIGPNGSVLAQAPSSRPLAPSEVQTARAAAGREDALIDLWGDNPRNSRVALALRVFAENASSGPFPPQVLGVVVLQVDAARTLYPLLTSRALPARTGETLLVRRVGGEVEFISPLRKLPAQSSFSRLPFEDNRLAANQAVAGHETVGEYVDYRNQKVLAATRRIPETGWGLIRKIDTAEALNPFYRTAVFEVLVAGFVVLAFGGLLRSYRHRAIAHSLGTKVEEQEHLLQLKEYSQLIVDTVPAGLLVLTPDLRVLSANQSFLESFNLKQEEVVGRRIDDVVKADGPPYRTTEVGGAGAPPQSVLLNVAVMGQARKRATRITITGIVHPEGEGRLLMMVEDQTESERLRAAAESSERRLRDLVQTVDAIVWEANARTLEFTFVSQRAERILGYPAAEWCWNSDFWRDHIFPADRERVVAECRSASHKQDEFELEYRMVAADGRVVWLRDKVRVVRDAVGEPLQLRGVMVDVTEERRAEEELRRVNRALKTLSQCNQAMAEATSELTSLAEVCRVLVEVGEYRFAWVGFAEQNEGKTIRPVTQAGHEAGYLSSLRVTWADEEYGRGPAGQAIRTGEAVVARDLRSEPSFPAWREQALRRGYAAMIALPLVADAQPLGVLAIYSDESGTFDAEEVRLLTELARNVSSGISLLRNRADRQRAEEDRARLSLAVEQAAEAIVITDIQGTIVYVNPAFETVTGYSRQDAIGKNPRVLKSGRQDAEFYANLWTTLLGGEAWSGRFINRRKDGTHFEAEAVISPVRDAAGRVTNYVCVQRDVTRERQLEEQVRRSQRIEAVGRLAGGVAHDFNNLLTIIAGYSDLLLQVMAGDDPKSAHVGEIKKAADRAAALTRQLLAFSRRQVLAPQVLDLNGVVTGLQGMMRRLIGEDIGLVMLPAKDLGRAKLDPGQIEQVILNLVINSRDAMPQGGKITIETANANLDEKYGGGHFPVKPGSYVMLAVSDTGCGMDANTQAHIFEPFFTTKEQGKGTGLGLSMVYGIVKQSGGYIWVFSEPGQGAAFKLYFPRVDAEAVAAQPAMVASVQHGGAETILLVEDDSAVRSLVSGVLKSSGYKVLVAQNGVDALVVHEQHQGGIDLLVTDVVMPQMNGPELAAHLARFRKKMKVIYISGYTDDAIVHHGVLDSDAAFLQKPFTPEALARKVREVLDTA